jgi:phage N-6-adenine-methyltransferase
MTIPTIVRTRGYHNPTPTDEWGTPAALFARLDAEFHYALDVAASPENAKCARWYGRQSDGSFVDGLTESWQTPPGTSAFCNPPYSAIAPWAAKAVEEARQGAFVTLLVPVNSDRVWWHDYAMRAWGIRLLKGRLRYEGPQKDGARFPSCVLLFGPYGDGRADPLVEGWDWRVVPTRARWRCEQEGA